MSPPNPSATGNNNNNDFLAKAQAATQRMVAASASVSQNATPQQTRIVQELAQDRPTIHAAVTSFLSLVAAKSMTTTTSTTGDHHVQEYYYGRDSDSMVTWSNAEALQCSRILLKAINSTTLSAMTPKTTKTSAKSNAQHKKQAEEEYALVAQLWNGLIASEQKPARFLGRRALQHAWSDIAAHPTLLYNYNNTDNNDSNDISQQSPQHAKLAPFLQEFERLLFLTPPRHEDNDAALIWDQDGGQAELQQRRERRQQRATQASKNEEEEKHDGSDSKNLPMIEEITNE